MLAHSKDRCAIYERFLDSANTKKNFCILALESGQRLLYRLGLGIGLVSVLVLRFCALKLVFKLICCKECIVDCAPFFGLVRSRNVLFALFRNPCAF